MHAYRTCAACSGSKRKAHALQHAHLTWAPSAGDTAVVVEASAWAPAVVDAAVVVETRVKCTSCHQFHDGVQFKTCSRCLMSRKDKTLQRRIIRAAATLEKRSDKKLCSTKTWCCISDFNEGASICRTHQEKARAATAARRTVKKAVSRNQQIAKALTALSHQEVQPQQGQKFLVVQCLLLLVNAPPVEVSDMRQHPSVS